MTSKEALEKLNFECIRSNGIDDEYAKELKIVERDLEVLEIIKNHILDVGKYINGGIYLKFHYGNYNPYYTIEIKEGIKKVVSIEEYIKIKEWLSNE